MRHGAAIAPSSSLACNMQAAVRRRNFSQDKPSRASTGWPTWPLLSNDLQAARARIACFSLFHCPLSSFSCKPPPLHFRWQRLLIILLSITPLPSLSCSPLLLSYSAFRPCLSYEAPHETSVAWLPAAARRVTITTRWLRSKFTIDSRLCSILAPDVLSASGGSMLQTARRRRRIK